jgi:putative endonuclease
VYEHRNKLIPGFTSQYKLNRLVFFETTTDIRSAISREKQIKGWTRRKKLALIESENPRWRDLSIDWYRRREDRDSSAFGLRMTERGSLHLKAQSSLTAR